MKGELTGIDAYACFILCQKKTMQLIIYQE